MLNFPSSAYRCAQVRTVAVVVVVLAGLGLGGCGSSSSKSSDSSKASGASTPTTSSSKSGPTSAAAHSGLPTGSSITASDVRTAEQFLGGKPGVATGSPITVGWASLAGSPENTPADNTPMAAVNLINNKLGGIDGHKLVLLQCDAGASAQAALQCGQKFRNDSAVKAVLNPGIPAGGAELLTALDGTKPEFCTVPTQAEQVGHDVFCPTAGVLSTGAVIPYLKSEGNVKTVAQLVPDAPTFQSFAAVFTHQMAAVGLKATTGSIPLTSPDVLSAVVASGAQHANAIFLTLASPGQCIAVAQALKTLSIPASTPIISLTECADPAVAAALGGVPHWTYIDLGQSPYVTPPSPQVSVFLDANHTYGGIPVGVFTQVLFGTTMWIAKTLSEAGPNNLSNAAVAAKAKAFTGPMFLGDPVIHFGSPPFPNFGSTSVRFYTVNAAGKWVNAAGGKWISALP